MKQNHSTNLSLVAAAMCGAILLPLVANAAESQTPPVVDEGVGVVLRVQGTAAGKTALKAGGAERGDVSTQHLDVSLGTSIGTDFDLGLNYGVAAIDLPDNNTTVALPSRLRTFGLSATYKHKLNDQWLGLVHVSPSWNTAAGTSSFSSHGFGVTTGAGFRYQSSPTMAYSFGLAYNSLARSSYRVIPVLGFEWKPSEQWIIAAGFPQTGVTYVFSKEWRFSWLLEGSGGAYYVEKDPLPGLAGKPSLAGTKLDYYEVRTGLNATYAFSKRTSVGVTVGTVLDRTFDYHEVHYKLKTKDNALYVSLNASIGF